MSVSMWTVEGNLPRKGTTITDLSKIKKIFNNELYDFGHAFVEGLIKTMNADPDLGPCRKTTDRDQKETGADPKKTWK